MVGGENLSRTTVSKASGEDTISNVSSSGNQGMPHSITVPPPKKKRNLPGMPDPDAEVVALSPKTLVATIRFVCEICNKGFQRDQNLQLHRRGHNFPWKLKQRTNKEPRKRVYVCPESSCVHHNPARALGDLTGIKKHFFRKHGEKKWKCERCSKKYAVQSDWKAHLKTCGTKEYKCDCGTLFSRRDSFVTHRAFCDALAEESARAQTLAIMGKEGNGCDIKRVVASPPPPPLTPSTSVVSPGLSVQSSELAENPIGHSPPPTACASATSTSSTSSASNVFATTFASSTATPAAMPQHASVPSSFPNLFCGLARSDCPATMPTPRAIEPPSLSLSPSFYLSNNTSSLFSTEQDHYHYTPSPQPAMSATALLQKAAQMGATTSNPSFLRGLGLPRSTNQDSNFNTWDVKPESTTTVAAGLGLGLPSSDVMMGSSSLFGNKPTTLDLLGLGMDAASSALLNSYSGGFNVGAAPAAAYGGGGGRGTSEETWDGVPERKPYGSTGA
ncbi:PREDICTED: zinc finger protein NUTCRACKER-like [Populus euphratica]|uniref:Zinc finger protein NUTCRACKER-like n=1 Tax=Populus euphratica TaxID=75702 RepID=A0AAJ6T9L8_POPEU|nr:PREDICTED: zinc finger protein NUTCRACKER-like [Populus euphratica]